MLLISGRWGVGGIEVSTSRASLLPPPRAHSGTWSILTGPRTQGQVQAALPAPGTWGNLGSDQAVPAVEH